MQKAHTAGLAAYLPSFLPALFPRPGALLQLLVDPERHILYARGQAAAVQARPRALPQGFSFRISPHAAVTGAGRGSAAAAACGQPRAPVHAGSACAGQAGARRPRSGCATGASAPAVMAAGCCRAEPGSKNGPGASGARRDPGAAAPGARRSSIWARMDGKRTCTRWRRRPTSRRSRSAPQVAPGPLRSRPCCELLPVDWGRLWPALRLVRAGAMPFGSRLRLRRPRPPQGSVGLAWHRVWCRPPSFGLGRARSLA